MQEHHHPKPQYHPPIHDLYRGQPTLSGWSQSHPTYHITLTSFVSGGDKMLWCTPRSGAHDPNDIVIPLPGTQPRKGLACPAAPPPSTTRGARVISASRWLEARVSHFLPNSTSRHAPHSSPLRRACSCSTMGGYPPACPPPLLRTSPLLITPPPHGTSRVHGPLGGRTEMFPTPVGMLPLGNPREDSHTHAQRGRSSCVEKGDGGREAELLDNRVADRSLLLARLHRSTI